MAEQKKEIRETFKIYYGVGYSNSWPLSVRRITAYLLDEITPKIQALQDFVNDMFEEVTGKIKDLKDSDEETLAMLRRINSTIMSKEEQDAYFLLLIDVVASFLNIDTGKVPQPIIDAFKGVLDGEMSDEDLAFWKNQDLEELKAALTFFRKKAGLGKV